MFAAMLKASGAVWKSQARRSFTRGMGEMAGMHYAKDPSGILRNTGFLGRKASSMGIRPLGTFGKIATGAGLAWGATEAIDAYTNGGVFGAAASGTGTLSIGGAFRTSIDAILLAPGPLKFAAAAGAVGYMGYAVGEAAKMHVKRLKGLEMGRDIPDMFGTISTIRQRSLQAIQNTHISGRTALGNEAFLMSRRY